MIKEFVRSSLPEYIIENDSYKDINQKGFVERYLEIFGDELDQEYVSKIETLVNQKNPQLTNSLYLDYIAGQLGDLPNISQDTAHYRNILSFIISLWQIKGTPLSFKAILYSANILLVNLVEVPPISVEYDDPAVEYDAVEEFEYDINCLTCSDYELELTGPSLTATIWQQILDLIALVEPINAKLVLINYNGVDVEEVFISVTVDENGDLVYNNANDPGLILTLDSNGDLIISGPNANRYYINENGDLIYLLY